MKSITISHLKVFLQGLLQLFNGDESDEVPNRLAHTVRRSLLGADDAATVNTYADAASK